MLSIGAGGNKKLTARWFGPYTITRKLTPVVFQLQLNAPLFGPKFAGKKGLNYQTANVARLKLYMAPDTMIPVSSPTVRNEAMVPQPLEGIADLTIPSIPVTAGTPVTAAAVDTDPSVPARRSNRSRRPIDRGAVITDEHQLDTVTCPVDN